jgi:hypothetical protein
MHYQFRELWTCSSPHTNGNMHRCEKFVSTLRKLSRARNEQVTEHCIVVMTTIRLLRPTVLIFSFFADKCFLLIFWRYITMADSLYQQYIVNVNCLKFFLNPILFAICNSTFSKLCDRRIQWHVEECSVTLHCN